MQVHEDLRWLLWRISTGVSCVSVMLMQRYLLKNIQCLSSREWVQRITDLQIMRRFLSPSVFILTCRFTRCPILLNGDHVSTSLLSGRTHDENSDNLVARPIIIEYTNRKSIVKLTEWLKYSDAEAKNVFLRYPQLRNIDVSLAEAYLVFLEKHGIPREWVARNPWLLLYNESTMRQKLNILSSLGVTEDKLYLLRYSCKQLRKLTCNNSGDQPKTFEERQEYLMRNLNCSNEDVAQMAVKHFPLFTMDFQRLKTLMELLISNNIPTEDIKNDLWIFRHNVAMITGRLQRARDAGVVHVKTWMLRCEEEVFSNTIKKWCRAKRVLGKHEDQISYLAERLECSPSYVRDMAERHPRLLTINPPKMKEVLDFLYDNGYMCDQVRQTPRVLSHSITTLQQRLAQFKELQYHPKHLLTLCMTKKEHGRFLERLRKEKLGSSEAQ